MNSKAKHKSNININNYNKEKGKKKDKKSSDSIEQFFNENASTNLAIIRGLSSYSLIL